MTVITRFAPSPTGFLHIGGARTALFNWLYAKHHKGQFYLRIEDTDRTRSTQAAIDAIIDGLKWLGLDWEGDAVYQYARSARHADVAHEMVKHGKAFKCYTTQAELEEFRKANPNAKFRSPWRDRHDHPVNTPYVIRIKAPLDGESIIHDKVQGTVTVKNAELDDMVLLRSDSTPTYMLAVVVDDHDMGVTQIIRGDDHLTNSFRQLMIYDAMGWEAPSFAHIPLIHGADGAKLSKRHGALGVDAYRDMGYLPEAIRNYLLRLGWSHGNDETISTEQAIEWFDLDAVGKSPSRFDFAKLENLNGHYIREADDERLAELITPFLDKDHGVKLTSHNRKILIKGMHGLKQRAKTLKELSDSAVFYVADDFSRRFFTHPTSQNPKVKAILEQGGTLLLAQLKPLLEQQTFWQADILQGMCKEWIEKQGKKLGDIAQPLRAALTGSTVSPSVFEVMEILGKEETLGRLKDVC